MYSNLSAPSGALIRAQEKKRLIHVSRIIFMTQEILFVYLFQPIILNILLPNTDCCDYTYFVAYVKVTETLREQLLYINILVRISEV